jgi:CIC family chloride channel protein
LDAPESKRPSSFLRALDVRRSILGRLRVLLRLRSLYFVRAEIRFAPTEAQRLFALTMLIGVVCGFAAVAFHLAIAVVEHALIDRAIEAPGRAWMGWVIVTPTLGGVVCGLLLQYVVPNARGSGIPQVKVAFAVEGGRLRMRDSIGKFVIGALQIGSGASLGREGPTVQICAGVASGIGRLTRVSPKSLRRLIPVGAAAGIAAAFNAPIAAVTFTIEEVVGNLDQAVLSGVIIAAALAAVIERSVLGEHPVFSVPQPFSLLHSSSLLIYAILGVASAGASIVFTDSLLGLRKRFRDSPIPEWMRPGVGGLVTGGLAVVAMWKLGTRGVTGGGYETLGSALGGNLAVSTMAILCAMKIAATVFSYSSGGAGGIFAPALFIGGMLGGAVGTLDRVLLHHTGEPVGAFALVGMGAVFSGIIRAPMTSVLIIVEMTGGYSLILPLMLANMTAYVLARAWRPVPIYEALLAQDGVHLEAHDDLHELGTLRLGQFVRRDAPFRSVREGAPAEEILKASSEAPGQFVFPVVGGSGRMAGIITSDELAVLRDEPDLLPLVNAIDIMRPPISAKLDDDLRSALETMIAQGIPQLPVTDAEGRSVGFVSEADIAKAYLRGQRPKRSIPDVDGHGA